jgi:hypothetical protein
MLVERSRDWNPSAMPSLVIHAVMGPYEEIIGKAAVADYPAVIGNGRQHTFRRKFLRLPEKSPVAERR